MNLFDSGPGPNLELIRQIRAMGHEIGLHDARMEADRALANMHNPIITHTEREHSVEVGRIVIGNEYIGVVHSRHDIVIKVLMNSHGITIEWPQTEGYVNPNLSSEKTIELGQLLLKAGELQSSYAEERKKLVEEAEKIDKRYADRINGLGTDVEVLVDDPTSTFKVHKALG